MTHILENSFIDQANVDMVSSYCATSNGSNVKSCSDHIYIHTRARPRGRYVDVNHCQVALYYYYYNTPM